MGDSDGVFRKGVKRRYKVIGVLILVLSGLFAGLFIHGRSQLDKKFDEVRAAGFPITLEELDAWYSIPYGSENAAVKYIAAFEAYYSPDSPDDLPILGIVETPKRGERFSAETVKLIDKFIANNNETLELLNEAVKIEHCRYPVDLTLGMNVGFPNLSKIKKSAQLLTLKAMLDSEKGSEELVAHDLNVSISLARSCENAPILLHQLVRIACLSLAVESAEYAVNRFAFNDEQLSGMILQFTQAEKPDAMLRAMAGERPHFIDYMQDPGKYPTLTFMRNSMPMSLYSMSGLRNSGLQEYIDLTNENLAALRLPLHERIDALKLTDEKMFDLPWWHLIIKINSAPVLHLGKLDLRSIAYLRACCVGLAVERYRLAEGKLPDSLDGLASGYIDMIPLDPFDGQALRYKRLDKGYVVYSVGEDGVDNGGKERTDENRKLGHDVTFTVERE